MAATQFLVRNRHCNVWYGRIVIPLYLREHFNGKRELRKSLGTPDRTVAKRLALEFWLKCQHGFDELKESADRKAKFDDTGQFLAWLPQGLTERALRFLCQRIKTSRSF